MFAKFEVNLNTLVPVLHFGLDVSVGSGIANVPEAAPAASVVKAAPAELPVGVTLSEISIPSKNGYILVDKLVPGNGYWVRTNSSGSIILTID